LWRSRRGHATSPRSCGAVCAEWPRARRPPAARR
jgi:hypothetical protein